MTGRKNAMLTTEDRRWLRGEKRYEGEHAKQQRYQRRRDIRKRVYNSLLDFSILFEHLEGAEREKLFGTPGTGQTALTEDRELADGIRDALAFLLYNTGVTSMMGAADDDPDPVARWLLTEAFHRAGRKDGLVVESVDVDVETAELPQAALLGDLEAGKELSPRELRLLLESDAVDTRAIQDHIRDQLIEE
ncbi:MAG: hypothetical protein PPP58_04675 [Natronomonas sp.]